MRTSIATLRSALVASTAIGSAFVMAGQAAAGGFAIREQSAQFQGSSFAGSAAGGGLSSMYWNPAAAGQAGWGLTSESHFSAIFGQAENTVETYTPGPGTVLTGAPANIPAGTVLPASTAAGIFGGIPTDSGDIADAALVGASYYAYKLSPSLTAALSINSGFGLTTKPTNLNYLGAELGRSTKLFTLNAAPTLAYKIMPGVIVGVGAQIQYAKAKLELATGAPVGPSSIYKDGTDVAFGATAGILIEPAAGTTIGLGWRSQLTHDLEGDFSFGPAPGWQRNIGAELNLPDIVTLSMRHAIAPNMRLLGTVEWTNWSRFKNLELTGETPDAVFIDANWSESWLFSVGGEYDMGPGFTLRAGLGYEISPVDDPTKRFASIPDNDRVWLSAGGSVQLTEKMSADFAYTHIFVENGDIDRVSLAGNRIQGFAEAQVDIFSASLKTRWGGEAPLK